MPLAQFTVGQHDPRCSGCPACRVDYARMLTETPMQTFRRLSSSALRTAAAGAVFRVSLPRPVPKKTEGEWRDHFGRQVQGFGSVQPDAPLDPYAKATNAAPSPPCTHDDPGYQPHGEPADGYQIALNRRRKP